MHVLDIPLGTDFTVLNDRDGTVYTRRKDGCITAHGMATLGPLQAQEVFRGAECVPVECGVETWSIQ